MNAGRAATTHTVMRDVAVFGFLLALGAVIYARFYDAFFIGDDFYLLFPRSGVHPWRYLVRPVPGVTSFRPLEATTIAAMQTLFGSLATVPIHLLQSALHAVLAFMVWLGSLRLGRTPLQAGTASLFVLTSQCAVLPVLDLDALSQQFVVLFGFAAVWFWWRWALSPTASTRTYLAAVLFLLLCLASKESGVGFSLGFALIAIVHTVRNRAALTRVTTGLLFPLAMTAVYLLYRSTLDVRQIGFGPGRYEYHFGGNIPVNALQLLAATTVPFPTSWLFEVSRSGAAWLTGLLVLLGSGLLVWLCVRYRDGESQPPGRLLVALGVVVSVPFLGLNQVSELYTYSLLPLLGLLTGSIPGSRLLRAGRPARTLVLFALAGMLAGQTISSVYKARQIHGNGAIVRHLFTRLGPHIERIARDSTITLCGSNVAPVRYSAFLMGPLDGILVGAPAITSFFGRPDVRIRWVESCPDPLDAGRSGSEVVLLFDGEDVHARPTTSPARR